MPRVGNWWELVKTKAAALGVPADQVSTLVFLVGHSEDFPAWTIVHTNLPLDDWLQGLLDLAVSKGLIEYAITATGYQYRILP